jgi:hypothetical protein
VARVPVQYGVELSHVWVWELRWGLGKSFAPFRVTDGGELLARTRTKRGRVIGTGT